MRVVGGRHRGTALHAPRGDATRPTTDRLRETIFNILAHRFDDPVQDARVLDLFAGTGALGIEALSRGATFALFVETGAEARAVIRRNVEAVGALGVTRVWRRDATKLGPCPVPPFDVVFADPPYGHGLGEAALGEALASGWLADGAIAVLEERADAMPAAIEGFEEPFVREAGESAVGFFVRTARA
ncbi:16S rRNA (guanine(966)-N(2))-methyltransferase RsmD [Acuticoccus sediminis]|uniref:16S rRNA (Guanine(966)-N(2))-methyltransferase RsmD n=2 Tax=Acuticoccus sediminis TaxID=2184697 RepID=A0A8B2P0A1_9HYPH|nr:16S rRNA (guanine(966)-N(2))-methyltransferase RsmD [Acuticoccus sediminis]RAI04501.1 16S rRNA (guanine(966)-N(2))-methyltransferase RsmD [Acuticoccus sediminis]